MKQQSQPQQPETLTLYQAVNPQQLAGIVKKAWRGIELGADGEQFCFLKLSQCYAEMIARQWDVPIYGAGYVMRLTVPAQIMQQYDLQTVAYEEHLEYCVPRSELPHINASLLEEVQVVSAFVNQHSYSIPLGTKPLSGLIGC